LDAAILQNTKNTAMALMKNSAIVKHLVEVQKVKIAAGIYSLATGKVELVDLSPEKEKK
jgi:carbonic anhydrase